MRIAVVATLMIGTVAAAAPSRAQTYNPDYPVCMHVVGPLSYFDCRFSSIPQCAASASGRGAQCVVNPYFANAGRSPVRRHRHTY